LHGGKGHGSSFAFFGPGFIVFDFIMAHVLGESKTAMGKYGKMARGISSAHAKATA
jgi:hypothetical protein